VERTVRPAGSRDAPTAAALLAAAFIDDPVMDWIQPVRSQRTPLLTRLFAVQLSHEYLPAGGVRVIDSPDGQPLAAAMWKPPTIATVGGTRREQISMAAALVGALRTRLPGGPGGAPGVGQRTSCGAALVSEQDRHRAVSSGTRSGVGSAERTGASL